MNVSLDRAIQRAWALLLDYHTKELSYYNYVVVSSRERGVELPLVMQQNIDQYLREDLPSVLHKAKMGGRAKISLVEQVEHLLDDVRKNVYPLRVQ